MNIGIKTQSPYEIIIISINIGITQEKKKTNLKIESYTLKFIDIEILRYNIIFVINKAKSLHMLWVKQERDRGEREKERERENKDSKASR